MELGGAGHTLSGNTCTGNANNGIYLSYASDAEVTGNTCTGIYLFGSDDNSITDNTCAESIYGGIQLKQADSNTISDNDADGISLLDASTGNTVTDNRSGDALYRLEDAAANTLTGNTCGTIQFRRATGTILESNLVRRNGLGMQFVGTSEDNSIYRNSFIDNVTSFGFSDNRNTWVTPDPVAYFYNGAAHTNHLGNYFSDYSGADTDGDGVGDTELPYPADGDGDLFPLIAPASAYTDGPAPTGIFALSIRREAATGTLHFEFPRLPPHDNYRVEVSADLRHWQQLTTLVVTGPTGSFSDQPPLGQAERYYRVIAGG